MQCCVCAERLASRLIRPSGQTSLLSFRQYLNGDCLELPRLASAGLHFISHPLTLTQLIDVIPALCDVNEHVDTAMLRLMRDLEVFGDELLTAEETIGQSVWTYQDPLAERLRRVGVSDQK